MGQSKTMRTLGRECGECTACCTGMAVKEVEKEKGTPCPLLCGLNPPALVETRTHGCSIYETRPKSCQDFRCRWLDGLHEDGDRPDRSGIILVTGRQFSGQPVLLSAHESWPGAFKEEPVLARLRTLAENQCLVLVTGANETRRLVGPEKLLDAVRQELKSSEVFASLDLDVQLVAHMEAGFRWIWQELTGAAPLFERIVPEREVFAEQYRE